MDSNITIFTLIDKQHGLLFFEQTPKTSGCRRIDSLLEAITELVTSNSKHAIKLTQQTTIKTMQVKQGLNK